MKRFVLAILLILALCPIQALAAGQWKLASVRTWPYRPNPKDPDVKVGQTLKSNGINFSYSVFDRNNTKQWLNSYVDFTWNFSTGITTLRPGEKIIAYGKVTHNGKYLDSGFGGMLVGDDPRTEPHGFRNDLSVNTWGYKSDWILGLTASNGTVKGEKEFKVPPGPNPDRTPLTILFVTSSRSTCGVEYVYEWSEGAANTATYPLGKVLHVNEVGRWEGKWQCRKDGKTFDAYWKNIDNGQEVRDVIVIEKINGDQVVLYRYGNQGRYYGKLTDNGTKIRGGTASWYQKDWGWNAVIER